MDNGEDELGFGCSCGFKTLGLKEFRTHLFVSGKRDGKGSHKSIGRVDMNTGEVILPPWNERSPTEKEVTSKYKTQTQKEQGPNDGDGKQSKGAKPSPLRTDAIANAQQVRVVPRVFTMDYSPIMRAAQDAAVNYWGWRPDMPLDNFIDTCLFLFFEEKGITLCGYIVDDSLLKKEAVPDGS